MSEVLRGKALAFVLERATITDASGRSVDLDSLTKEFEPSDASADDEPADDGAVPAE
jgi:trigger factor